MGTKEPTHESAWQNAEVLRKLPNRVHLRRVTEKKLKETPTVIRSTRKICTQMTKSRSLQIIRSFGDENISKSLPSRRLSSINQDTNTQLA